MAGKTLVYELEIKEKIDDRKDKIKAICEYYKCDPSDVIIKDGEVEIIMVKDVDRSSKELIANDVKEHIGINKIKFSEIFEVKTK